MLVYAKTSYIIVNEFDLQEAGYNYHVFTKVDETTFKIELYRKEATDPDTLLDSKVVNMGDYKGTGAMYEITEIGLEQYSPVRDYDYIYSGRTSPNAIVEYNRVDAKITDINEVVYNYIGFYSPKTAEDFIVMLGVPTKFVGIEPIEVPYSARFSDIVQQSYPEYREKCEIMHHKRNLLIQLDPNNSLSYLETQIDLLSKMLFAVVEANPVIKEAVLAAVPQYSNFKDAIGSNSVFNIKDDMVCVDEIRVNKQYVRNRQSQFLQDKAAIKAKYE